MQLSLVTAAPVSEAASVPGVGIAAVLPEEGTEARAAAGCWLGPAWHYWECWFLGKGRCRRRAGAGLHWSWFVLALPPPPGKRKWDKVIRVNSNWKKLKTKSILLEVFIYEVMAVFLVVQAVTHPRGKALLSLNDTL